MKSNCITSEQMASIVDETVSVSEQQQLLLHVVNCSSCYKEYLLLLEVKHALSQDDLDEQRDASVINLPGGLTPLADDTLLVDLDAAMAHDLPLAAAGDDHDNSAMPNAGSLELAGAGEHQLFGEKASTERSMEVHQASADTCAIKAQQLVLKDFGIHVSEAELVKESLSKGWYVPSSPGHEGGTHLRDIGKLLESHGVETHQAAKADIYTLINELAQGHEVIVDIDASSLRHPGFSQTFKDLFAGGTPNHALIVAGINIADNNQVSVILKDPGTGDVAKAYPLGHFLDSWRDSNYFMVATNTPAPDLKNFDYTSGHISHVGTYNYHDFQESLAARFEPDVGQSHDVHQAQHFPVFIGNSFILNKVIDYMDHHFHHHSNQLEPPSQDGHGDGHHPHDNDGIHL
jgi:hypothetical protein